jgi:4-amino-4-deoxy-L-arabinose transferase-like glycosyltransferase
MGAAFWIGQEVDDWRTGLVAALLVALTPTYTTWASSGYADLPAGFFYMLTVVYALRWERDGRLLDALLAGMMAGLAAWTKNTALIVLPTLVVRGLYMLWYTRRSPNWRGVALIMVAALLVAAPWYVRALLTAGVIVPSTAWADRALRTPASLLPYWMTPTFGVAGLAFTGGVLYALWRVIRARGRDPGTAALLIFYLPYFGAWWWLASYDSRFLLTVIGCVAVMGAQACRALWARLDPDGAWLRQRAVQGVAALAVIVLAAPVAFNTLDFKADLWRNPLMSVEERFRTVHGGRYLMAQHISAALPPGSRLWVQDNRLPFLIDGMQCVVGGWPSAAAQLAGMHYWVISPSDALPEWFAPAFGSADPLFEADGYRLFALTPP